MHIATRPRAQHNGSQMTPNIVTMKTATGEEAQIDLANNGSIGEGKRFLPELADLLQSMTDVALDDVQAEQLDKVLKTLPEKAGIAELVEALAGNEQLAQLRAALQVTHDQGRYTTVFDQAATPFAYA
uniref:Uncharacterized protein n=2 Tax=Pseudomonas fluorescens TaxID=294 RepID=A4V7I6_PSEFS|nr:hypothetical protein pQBR0091 [Pseudomonas fluorescens SBW25]